MRKAGILALSAILLVASAMTCGAAPKERPGVGAPARVTVDDGEYAPPQKKKIDLGQALGGDRPVAAQAQGAAAVPFVQGQDNTEEILRAQREAKERAKNDVPENLKDGKAPENLEDAVNQYKVLGDLLYQKMYLKAESELMALKRQRALDEREFNEKMSVKADDVDFERLMGMPLPQGASPLPVIQAERPAQPQPEPAAPAAPEPPDIRVVGIQGYKGKFTAQIMNNGVISNISPGADIDGGYHVLSINEQGVKVRHTHRLPTGETQSDVMTLPLSK